MIRRGGAPGTVQTHVSCRSRFALSGRVAIGRTDDETGKRRETRHIGAEVGVGSDTTDRLRGCRVRLPAHSIRLRLTKYNIANPTSFRGKCYVGLFFLRGPVKYYQRSGDETAAYCNTSRVRTTKLSAS